MAKQPTAQGISALLRKAGFTPSVFRRSGSGDRSKSTEGYRVGRIEGAVTVRHVFGYPVFTPGGVTAQVREHEKLNAYTETIEAAGYAVQRDQVGFGMALIVKASADPEEA